MFPRFPAGLSGKRRSRPRSVVVVAMFLFAVASCDNGALDPGDPSRMESVSGDDQPGFVGIPLDEKLAVRVVDVNNAPVPDRLVTWSVLSGVGSVTPVQSRTDALGIARTTWTLGLDVGTQEAAANISGLEPVSFSATAEQLGDTCAEDPLDLGLGASVVLLGAQSTQLCLASSQSDVREYVAVAFNGAKTSGATVSLSVVANGIVAVAGDAAPAADVLSVMAPALQRDADFDAQIRDLERRELGPRVRPVGAPAVSADAPAPLFSLSNPVPGEVITLNARATSACTNALDKQGRVVAVTQRALVVADLGNPPGGFTDSDYGDIAREFDDVIYPLDAEYFGEPGDFDSNNRVVLFYTAEVNRLTPAGSPAGFVAGFFFARDLFPRVGNSRLSACATSNQSEILYLMVPDPGGVINGNSRTKSFVQQHTASTIAHEMVHLVNASKRLYENHGARYPERAWVEEGLAHSAEERLFFESAGLNSGANIGASGIQGSQLVADAFNDHQADNFRRLRDYMISPNQNWAHLSSSPALAARGAATYFFRYVADRLGGDEAAVFRALVSSSDTGHRNIESVIHADPVQWMREWSVALLLDDLVPDPPERHMVSSWNARSLWPLLFQTSQFALRPTVLANGVARSATLQPSGSLYYRMGVPANGEGRLQVTANTLPAALSVTVVRVR